MAYVRKRGNQLAIIHRRRDPDTGKVKQQVLFRLYSRKEARAAIGQGEDARDKRRFASLLGRQYPAIRFDWRKIRETIAANLDVLPERYGERDRLVRADFRESLCAFTRDLMRTEPREHVTSAGVIADHKAELEFLVEQIQRQLKLCEQEATEESADDEFNWRYATRLLGAPPAIEERVTNLYEKGELDRAETLFRLLTDSFDDYADGHNYLGLIALERGDLEQAEEQFRRTMEVGSRLFLRRRPRSVRWSYRSNRPYIRGMSNLTLTLLRAGRYDEAETLCSRLERECDDDVTARVHFGAIYLCAGRWSEAYAAVKDLRMLYSHEDFLAAFALAEMGEWHEAIERFAYAALHNPRTARLLVGKESRSRPALPEEVRDHDTGIELERSLHAYLVEQRPPVKRFFRRIVDSNWIDIHLDIAESDVRKRHEEYPTGKREDDRRFVRVTPTKEARYLADDLADLACEAAGETEAVRAAEADD